jgi:hypothetical protein
MKRKYRLSKMYTFVDVAGNKILMPVFSDLSDEDLRTQFNFYLEREDFEYMEQVVGEAALRGIRFEIKKRR